MTSPLSNTNALTGCDHSTLLSNGKILVSPQKVRLRCEIWSNCPMAALKYQDQSFVFSSATFDKLPDSITSQIRMPTGGVDGVSLQERPVRYSNIVFVSKSGTAPATGSTSTTPSDSMPIQGNKGSLIKTLWDGKQAIKPQMPHYAWDVEGSLFDPSFLTEDQYQKPPAGKENYAKFGYSIRTTIAKETSNQDIGGSGISDSTAGIPDTVADIAPQYVLQPEQTNTSLGSNAKGVHFSVLKRQPVFQGADMFIILRQSALEGTVQPATAKLQDKFNFLDSSITKLISSKNGGGQIHVNSGVIETDENYQIIDSSRKTFDLNSQKYILIELGASRSVPSQPQANKDHRYFIMLCENAFPVFLHVGTPNMAVPAGGGGGGTTYTVSQPTATISRKISSYRGATGGELIGQRNLILKIKNHLGQIVIYFSGHEDNPWIITRNDLLQPLTDPTDQNNQSSDSNAPPSGTDAYSDSVVPMVVQAEKIAIHSGNMKLGFEFGYQQYENQTIFTIPQQLQIQGTKNGTPSKDDINLLLRSVEDIDNPDPQIPPRAVTTTDNDTLYYQDGMEYHELYQGTPVTTTASKAQPNSYKLYGKGHDGTGKPPTGTTNSFIEIKMKGELKNLQSNENRAQYFYANYRMSAGSYKFPSNKDGPTYVLANSITPIATGWRLVLASRDSAWGTGDVKSMDVSHQVMSFQRSFTAQDWTKLEHTGSIKFLVNEGMDFSNMQTQIDNSNIMNPLPSTTNYTSQLLALCDKIFYLRIWAWYEPGLSRTSDDPTNFPSYDEIDSLIFTGIATGGKVTVTTNARVMECALFDYSKILDSQFFINSPFFDSMKDFYAVLEILRISGMREDNDYTELDDICPASLLKAIASNSASAGDWFNQAWQNGTFTSTLVLRTYALPGSYDRLTAPKFRFEDGKTLLAGLTQIAGQSGKIMYFDRFGMFHYENRPDERLFYNSQSLNLFASLAQDKFYPTPVHPDLKGRLDAQYRLAYNSYSWQRYAAEVYNQLIVISASPQGELLVGGDMNFDSLDNPQSTGFLGFQRTLLQMTGVFGSEQAVKDYLQYSTKVYKPPLGISLETWGRSYLKPLDIITFTSLWPTDEKWGAGYMPLRINNLTTEIDPRNNIWWDKLECEWIYPGNTISFPSGAGG